MQEQELFKQVLALAIENRSDDFPENAPEFMVHIDTKYNVFMMIKGEWQFTGTNVSPV